MYVQYHRIFYDMIIHGNWNTPPSTSICITEKSYLSLFGLRPADTGIHMPNNTAQKALHTLYSAWPIVYQKNINAPCYCCIRVDDAFTKLISLILASCICADEISSTTNPSRWWHGGCGGLEIVGLGLLQWLGCRGQRRSPLLSCQGFGRRG